jgi:hypothetical protein
MCVLCVWRWWRFGAWCCVSVADCGHGMKGPELGPWTERAMPAQTFLSEPEYQGRGAGGPLRGACSPRLYNAPPQKVTKFIVRPLPSAGSSWLFSLGPDIEHVWWDRLFYLCNFFPTLQISWIHVLCILFSLRSVQSYKTVNVSLSRQVRWQNGMWYSLFDTSGPHNLPDLPLWAP